MSEAWITVLSCRLRNIFQKGQNRARRSKNVSYKHWGIRHRHTRDSRGWQHCVFIPLAKHPLERRERLRRRKNVLSLDSVRKEDGRRLDRFYVIICTNSLFTSFPSHRVSIFTHAFLSLFRIFYILRTVHVTPVTSHQLAPHCGYNAVVGESGAGSHLLHTNRHSLPTK
jgi:hypothetical protein